MRTAAQEIAPQIALRKCSRGLCEAPQIDTDYAFLGTSDGLSQGTLPPLTCGVNVSHLVG